MPASSRSSRMSYATHQDPTVSASVRSYVLGCPICVIPSSQYVGRLSASSRLYTSSPGVSYLSISTKLRCAAQRRARTCTRTAQLRWYWLASTPSRLSTSLLNSPDGSHDCSTGKQIEALSSCSRVLNTGCHTLPFLMTASPHYRGRDALPFII